jgi:hypothetical protein
MSRARKMIQLASGYVAERSGRLLRTTPGVLGALLVSYGLYRAWLPLGFIASGGFLLLVDRRVP